MLEVDLSDRQIRSEKGLLSKWSMLQEEDEGVGPGMGDSQFLLVDVSKNVLRTLPNAWGTGLVGLDLSHNPLDHGEGSWCSQLGGPQYAGLREVRLRNVGLSTLSVLQNCSALEHIDASFNHISDIEGLELMVGLKSLRLADNFIRSVQTARKLLFNKELIVLDLAANPICLIGGYRAKVKNVLPHIEVLDDAAFPNSRSRSHIVTLYASRFTTYPSEPTDEALQFISEQDANRGIYSSAKKRGDITSTTNTNHSSSSGNTSSNSSVARNRSGLMIYSVKPAPGSSAKAKRPGIGDIARHPLDAFKSNSLRKHAVTKGTPWTRPPKLDPRGIGGRACRTASMGARIVAPPAPETKSMYPSRVAPATRMGHNSSSSSSSKSSSSSSKLRQPATKAPSSPRKATQQVDTGSSIGRPCVATALSSSRMTPYQWCSPPGVRARLFHDASFTSSAFLDTSMLSEESVHHLPSPGRSTRSHVPTSASAPTSSDVAEACGVSRVLHEEGRPDRMRIRDAHESLGHSPQWLLKLMHDGHVSSHVVRYSPRSQRNATRDKASVGYKKPAPERKTQSATPPHTPAVARGYPGKGTTMASRPASARSVLHESPDSVAWMDGPSATNIFYAAEISAAAATSKDGVASSTPHFSHQSKELSPVHCSKGTTSSERVADGDEIAALRDRGENLLDMLRRTRRTVGRSRP